MTSLLIMGVLKVRIPLVQKVTPFFLFNLFMSLTRLCEFGTINAATSVHSVSGVPAYAVILSASRESDTGLLKVNA